ncbi:hypothetical protein ACTNDG_00165 [Clostridium sp. HCP1S3_B4]
MWGFVSKFEVCEIEYVVFGAKKAGTPLFFSRPKGAGSEVFGKVKAKRF